MRKILRVKLQAGRENSDYFYEQVIEDYRTRGCPSGGAKAPKDVFPLKKEIL
jgi:hypothetical protein